jgi:hypothetical protein
MDETHKILEYIGLAVLGNFLLLAAVFVLVAWNIGWRNALRRIWEWALVVSVYFGVILFGVAVPGPAVSQWLALRTHFSGQQIRDENLRVERFVGKTRVVFSNGEERPVPRWHALVLAPLVLAWWLLDLWVTRWVARRFAPTVWAELPGRAA